MTNKINPRTRSPDDSVLADGLFQLAFQLYGALARIAEAHQLSMVQVRLLGILRDRKPGMLELAGYLGLEKSSLSGLVDRAEKRGLVQRLPSPSDRRVARVRLTPTGQVFSRRVERQAYALVTKLIGALSRDDRQRLTRLIVALIPPGPARALSTGRSDPVGATASRRRPAPRE